MTSIAHALRRPAARRLISRACANLLAVCAITAIFGLKALVDARATASPAPTSMLPK